MLIDCSLMDGEIRLVILAQSRPHRVQVRYLHAGPREGLIEFSNTAVRYSHFMELV
jgi:hypothetical protein